MTQRSITTDAKAYHPILSPPLIALFFGAV